MKTFDSENHIYQLDDARLPGATDIIKSQGLIDPTWLTEEACWRGKCVHRGIELLVKGSLDIDTVDESIKGYLRSFEIFIRVSGFKIMGAEEPCFDSGFAAMPDLWGELNGANCVIELKTGKVPKWAKIQTALQVRALRRDKGFVATRRFGLELRADGRISNLIPFDDAGDDYAALSMVQSFWWRKENGYLKVWE